MTDIPFLHRGIILDACCIINLYASGHMQNILESIPIPVAVAAYVHDMESHRIYSGPDEDVMKETKLINLEPFVHMKLLQVVSLENEFEEITAVNFSTAAALDTGEAITAAIAIHRSWTIATDDKAAISFFMRKIPELHVISTLDMLKHWVDSSHPEKAVISIMLRNIRNRARYEPHAKHHLYEWWRSYRESELL